MATWKKVAAYAVVGLVGSCCACGTLGALMNSNRTPGSTVATTASSRAASASPSREVDGGARTTAASATPLDAAGIAAAIRIGRDAAQTGEAKVRARDFVAASTQLAAADAALAPLDPGSAEVTEIRARLDPIRAQLRSFGPTLALLVAARQALSDDHPDALAQYDSIRAARAPLEQAGNVPSELSRDVARSLRDLARAEDRLRDRALDIRTDRTIAERGLIRVSARELANVFRENEVAAESSFVGRRLAVDGVVDDISSGVFGGATVHLRTSNMFMPVDAEIARADAARLGRGTRVLMDCECNGAVIGRPQLDECRMLVFWQ